ncbi:hypothetical protein SPBR_07858 [Sporothrix brasiliensis 5110]|uniref:Uncharacterized protein n=1 Tax=Sporothrix brasiliensis 5110 TaxID=1398154 RepID=A0A0C2IWG6_9PEZI|nr:uncharacterized protein SPBR_07858 [Sporothrix brasiliensis 5110]KIH89337.1 hypothetical protein SPBR_07858 [Sporothrix brasiliensis 5110]
MHIKKKNKDRLYVCLYVRGGKAKMPGGEDRFHWALVVAPKHQQHDICTRSTVVGRRFHAKEDMSRVPYTWTVTAEDEQLGTHQSARLLTRVLVGKVGNRTALEATLRGIPVRDGQAGYDGWNCVAWVAEALAALGADGNDALSAAMLDWERVRRQALSYTDGKIASHRFDGQPAAYTFVQDEVPTYDLMVDREVVP